MLQMVFESKAPHHGAEVLLLVVVGKLISQDKETLAHGCRSSEKVGVVEAGTLEINGAGRVLRGADEELNLEFKVQGSGIGCQSFLVQG